MKFQQTEFNKTQMRAEIILEEIERRMEQGYDLSSPDLLDAFKGTFCLAKRNLKMFRRSFSESGYNFCILSTEAIWEDCADLLDGFGYQGLSHKEKEILKEALEKLNQ